MILLAESKITASVFDINNTTRIRRSSKRPDLDRYFFLCHWSRSQFVWVF